MARVWLVESNQAVANSSSPTVCPHEFLLPHLLRLFSPVSQRTPELSMEDRGTPAEAWDSRIFNLQEEIWLY